MAEVVIYNNPFSEVKSAIKYSECNGVQLGLKGEYADLKIWISVELAEAWGLEVKQYE